jgi:putative ABC transport system permease protein
MVFTYVKNEYSYDKFHANSDRIYRAAITGLLGTTVIEQAYTCAPLPRALYAECPEVESVVRVTGYGSILTYGDKVFFENDQIMADSSFFQVFSFPIIEGDPNKALSEPNTMIITESFAKKYFGDENPIGKSIIHGDDRSVRVTAVIKDIPENLHIKFDFIFSLITFSDYANNDQWYNNNIRTYILLKKGFDYKKTEAKFAGILEKYTGNGDTFNAFTKNGNYWHFYLQPLSKIHLTSNLSGEFEANGDLKYVHIFILIGIFILIIACVNYMNLTTARSANRANEIGIKKVVGSSKGLLIGQFLTESVLVSFCSMLLGLILAKFCLPYFADVLNRDLSFPLLDNLYIIPILLGLTLVVGFISGSYPAFYLSSLKPVSVLKGKISTGNKSLFFRNALVIFQFSISVILIAATIIINKQLNYIKNERLGFDKENVLVIENRFLLDVDNAFLKEELQKNINIENVALSHTIPGRGHNNWGMSADGIENLFTLNVCGCDPNFKEVMGLEMIEGRFFNDSISSDNSAMILNETAAKLFNWEDGPVGKRISDTYNVIGIVKDYHYESMHQKVRPMALLYSGVVAGLSANYILIKTKNNNIPSVIADVEKFWNQHTDGSAMKYTFLDTDYGKLYDNEQQTSSLFMIFSILAILIACLGLIGLSTYMIEQRIKEIGVRKVNCAKIIEIVKMLNLDFATWVIIAYVISCPMAYWAINSWLDSFAYHTEIGWMAFLVAGIFAFTIAILTVSWQTFRAARRNPVEALRYE